MASPKRKTSHDGNIGAGDAAGAGVVSIAAAEAYAADHRAQARDLTIGDILKRERERRGYDLQQIADYLCIRRGLLAAIEGGRYEEFTADAYAIGFLRSYAELIGLNGQDAINRYRQEMAGRRRKPDLVLPTPISEGRAPTAVIAGAAALASLLVYILWYAFSASDRATVTTPPTLPTSVVETSSLPATAVPGATETLAASTPSGIAIAAPAPASTPMQGQTPQAQPSAVATSNEAASSETGGAASAAHIVIKADQSSWVLISGKSGQTLYDHVMKPGESYQVPNQPGLSLTVGNGAGIVIALDGVDLPRLSNVTSHIVRNVPLETNALKAFPKAAD